MILFELVDPRLSPHLKRTRSGSTQVFTTDGWNDVVCKIQPPERHYYAELVDGKWFWVNGCDECCGKKSAFTYIRCETHDVCATCKTPRSKMTETPWGHQDGIECKPCRDKRRLKEKNDALEKMGPYDSWDFAQKDHPTCPWCAYEIEDYHDYLGSEDEEVECDRCDHKFLITAEHTVTFSSARPEART